jgi:hypothetical protein
LVNLGRFPKKEESLGLLEDQLFSILVLNSY